MQAYIRKNLNRSITEIALTLKGELLPFKQFIINQIEGLKKSQDKLPLWHFTENIIFPEKVSLEQSSSEITAKYKSELLKGINCIDLTGGFGIDSFYFSKRFKHVTYLERNKELFDITKWNHQLLGANNIEHYNDDGIEFLKKVDYKCDLIYVDPARRDIKNNKLFKLSECEPDVIDNQLLLNSKANNILIKTSPMLDIEASINMLKDVCEVHVVAVDNECKEVLYFVKKAHKGEPTIKTINFSKRGIEKFEFKRSVEKHIDVDYSFPQAYLYEPNAAILKAGAFKTISNSFKVSKLEANSHLYTNNEYVLNFPGRTFSIKEIFHYKDSAVHNLLPNRKANVITRNFPYAVDEIKKVMKITDGGNMFLIATRTQTNALVLIVAEKITF